MANKQIYFTPEGSPVVPDKYDMRVRMRNLVTGIITQEGLKKHLESLPDDTEHGDLRSFDAIVHGEEEATDEGAPSGEAEGPVAH